MHSKTFEVENKNIQKFKHMQRFGTYLNCIFNIKQNKRKLLIKLA